jgi:hypothetical protein
LCAAIRGNGQFIFAHFTALAHVVEHFGAIDAAAGGSSGSITTFLLESIQMNPAVEQCGEAPCSDEEKRLRIALLLKSIEGYAEVLGGSDEAVALGELAGLATEVQQSGVDTLVESDPAAAAQALSSVLESSDLRALINPEVTDLLANSTSPEFHVRDIYGSVVALGDFMVDSDRIFIRPGVIDFRSLGRLVGRMASFYAGYEPADAAAMAAFLDACAAPAFGKKWPEIRAIDAGGQTCGARFTAQAMAFRTAFDDTRHHSRADDPVGAHMHALAITSVLDGDAARASFMAARAAYAGGDEPDLQISFDDVRYGYFGRTGDLTRIAENRRGYSDLKTEKFHALGEGPWIDALATSPAEPGLARIQELDGLLSAGGWPDLAPVLALENLGCEHVFLITREGDSSEGFAPEIVKRLGGEDRIEELYSLADPDDPSSELLSIQEAEAILCTDWGERTFDIRSLGESGEEAELITRDPFFQGRGFEPLRETTTRVGCRP